MRRVSGRAEILWTVEIPDEHLNYGENKLCEPHIQAVLDFIPQMGKVYSWGENVNPATVFIEMHEEDFETEESEDI